MSDSLTPDTEVWNVEPTRYTPDFVSKYHLAREGDCLAKCSPRIIRDLTREDICRKCVPTLPADSEPRSKDQ